MPSDASTGRAKQKFLLSLSTQVTLVDCLLFILRPNSMYVDI